MRLLVVASDSMEFPGILAHGGHPLREAYAADWVRSVDLGGHRLLLVANGVGSGRAAAAVDAAAGFHPDAIVSTGFCGALEDKLGIGDIVLATEVETAHGLLHALPLASSAAFHAGKVISTDHVVQTSEEKHRLRAMGACAVEMEAGGVAQRAQDLGVPFYCVKAVTDLAGETLANDFNAALRSDGHFATISILSGTLRKPAARMPELLRLRNRCRRAARLLGEFFADCRF